MGKRTKVLGKRRTTVIVTLAVLLLATAVVIGSGANFTSQSTNPGNAFSAAGFNTGVSTISLFFNLPLLTVTNSR